MAFIDLPMDNAAHDLETLCVGMRLPIVLWCHPRWCEQLSRESPDTFIFKPDGDIPEFLDNGFIPIYSSREAL